ncbi:MAG: ABC transporter permease [Anaerolineales bacterium]|nr:ABC transporter permease [Anaerolineales bacterium]
MRRYLARRLITSVGVLLGISVLVFSISRLVPGDIVDVMLGTRNVTAEAKAALRAQLGLDAPIPVQYLVFLGNAVRGEFGVSLTNKMPVARAIGEQLPNTVVLAAAALAVALGIGFPLGIFAALRPGSWADTLAMAVSVTGLSIPTFWLGLMLILFFSVQLGWLPSIHKGSDPLSLIMPALTLGLPEAAVIARMVRASLLDVLSQEYIVAARAKGAGRARVIFKHALRNALIPVVTFLGLQMAYLLGGSAIVETIFARPGIGRLAVSAISSRDYPLLQGVVLVTASIYVVVNTLTDLTYMLLNPKIRLT